MVLIEMMSGRKNSNRLRPLFKKKFKSLSNLALLLVTSIIATLSASGSSASEDIFNSSFMQELVGSYCVVCHSDTAMTAGLSLEVHK